jgi:hypothetical protein
LKKDQAVALSNLIETGNYSSLTNYEIRKLETEGGILPHFHQWTNGKQTVAGFEVTRFDANTARLPYCLSLIESSTILICLFHFINLIENLILCSAGEIFIYLMLINDGEGL